MKPLRPEGLLNPWQELLWTALLHPGATIRGTGEAVAIAVGSGTGAKLHSGKDVKGRPTHPPPSSSSFSSTDPHFTSQGPCRLSRASARAAQGITHGCFSEPQHVRRSARRLNSNLTSHWAEPCKVSQARVHAFIFCWQRNDG